MNRSPTAYLVELQREEGPVFYWSAKVYRPRAYVPFRQPFAITRDGALRRARRIIKADSAEREKIMVEA